MKQWLQKERQQQHATFPVFLRSEFTFNATLQPYFVICAVF